jgi:hypothetical protein
MLKKTLSAVAVVALASAAAAGAAETNPLNPGYQTFAAKIEFAPAQGTVQLTKNPLQPDFYQWNAAPITSDSAVQIVMNNPLQPNFKRS